MGKSKIAIYGLITLATILCMMTIYMQMQNNKLRITNNRVEGDYEILKQDYEKLYAAYYSYDKKILEILKFSEKVYWAKDSSAFVVGNCFSFYKKPRMEKEYYLWGEVYKLQSGSFLMVEYFNLGRVDSLKPHQFINIQKTINIVDALIIAAQGDDINYPDINTITTIKIK